MTGPERARTCWIRPSNGCRSTATTAGRGPGWSGSCSTTATRLVVKHTSPAVDLVMRMTGLSVSRECRLWQAGVLDRLGPVDAVGHAVVGAWVEGDESVWPCTTWATRWWGGAGG